jgi:FkbM family methyltransferase
MASCTAAKKLPPRQQDGIVARGQNMSDTAHDLENVKSAPSRPQSRRPRRWWNVARFDVLEVALLVVLAAIASGAVVRWRAARVETGWLQDRYGVGKWSHNAEEWIIRDFFQDKRGGVFVDVGAADARSGSNTYFLESRLGWSGIAVDALTEYSESYRQHRPRTRFYALFVGDRSDEEATMYVSSRRTEASSTVREFTRFYAGSDLDIRKVPTITLTKLLTETGVDKIDLLSMDIELSEPKALAGFHIGRFRPGLICIESHPPIRQGLIDYFARHGYSVVGKYLLADHENLYFAPLGSA